MRIRVLAWITFLSLFRNKVIILFVAVFLCIVLLMMTPLTTVPLTTEPAHVQGMVLILLTAVMSMVSGFGSLLVA